MANGDTIEQFVDSMDKEALTDLVYIVAQQDPTEAKAGGGARWNSDQRDVIMQSQQAIDEAGLGD